MSTVGRPRSRVEARRWTKAEYYQMAEAGFFAGQRVELLEGQVVVLSPQNPQHWAAVDLARDTLARHFASGYHVRMQGPIDLGQTTEPEADVCVVAGARVDYAQAHPTTAALIVEVSDWTLSYDRRRKGSLYARAGIADYWVVNLRGRQVEVYRAPVIDTSRPYGHRYSSRVDLQAGATVSPLALPQVVIAVTELLP